MLHLKEEKGIIIAYFEGIERFNAHISQTVKDKLNLLFENKGTKVVLDLSGIHFIDSSAFGTLISVLKTAKLNNGVFKICCANEEVTELFNIMQLNVVFDLYKTLDACLKSIK
ncbi:MAG: STAS domain-containing protein [Bacteroidales bacterium]